MLNNRQLSEEPVIPFIDTELGKINIESEGLSLYPLVDFEESILISNGVEDIIWKIDLKANKISTYERNSFLRKIYDEAPTNKGSDSFRHVEKVNHLKEKYR